MSSEGELGKEDKMRRTYTLDEARDIAGRLAIDFESAGFDIEQFLAGLDVEAEHGRVDPETNVTDDDALTTGKIALAHLRELPDYYTRLEAMESGAAGPKRGRVVPLVVVAGVLVVAVVAAVGVCNAIRGNRAALPE